MKVDGLTQRCRERVQVESGQPLANAFSTVTSTENVPISAGKLAKGALIQNVSYCQSGEQADRVWVVCSVLMALSFLSKNLFAIGLIDGKNEETGVVAR